MAAVYEAEQLSLGKKVAVKVLASELAASTIVIERFFREARAAASVKSPYIVDVYDSGRLDDGRPFIAMELLEGESLYDRMARIRIIDVDDDDPRHRRTARKGLMKAHARGHRPPRSQAREHLPHEGRGRRRDLQDPRFRPRQVLRAGEARREDRKRLTREGAVFGTPAYMSPEQVKGQGNVDHRADLWALGCMAYECLIGRPVWNTDQGVAMTFAAIATRPIPVPSKMRADLPPAFDAWFKKCLERDPNKRFQTAKELADTLKASLLGPVPGPVSYVNISNIDDLEAHGAGEDDATIALSKPLTSPPRNSGPPTSGEQDVPDEATTRGPPPMLARGEQPVPLRSTADAERDGDAADGEHARAEGAVTHVAAALGLRRSRARGRHRRRGLGLGEAPQGSGAHADDRVDRDASHRADVDGLVRDRPGDRRAEVGHDDRRRPAALRVGRLGGRAEEVQGGRRPRRRLDREVVRRSSEGRGHRQGRVQDDAVRPSAMGHEDERRAARDRSSAPRPRDGVDRRSRDAGQRSRLLDPARRIRPRDVRAARS